eukprot:Selendium_serpulae@DN6215_c0_g1_i2.p1
MNSMSDLREMCSKTKCILATVGPLCDSGEALIEACIECKTDYCDLTGDLFWVRDVVNKYHHHAEAHQVKIVNFCGRESVFSDLGVMLVQNTALAHFNHPIDVVHARIIGGVGHGTGGKTLRSGGAVQSFFRSKATPRAEWLRVEDPYYLCGNSKHPANTVTKVEQPRSDGVEYDPELKKYVVPFPPSKVNTRVVMRSNFLSANRYGSRFIYHENLAASPNYCVAHTVSFGLKAVDRVFTNKVMRLAASQCAPKSGEGPSERQRNAGFFWMTLMGRTYKANGEVSRQVVGKVGSDQGDASYTETAKILAECGLCVAFSHLPEQQLPETFGVLTPSVAFGTRLTERLNDAGLTFGVESIDTY